KINQIVSNLARNAVKFCNEGSIIIQGYGHEDELEIVVSDTGIGIGEEALKSIFDPFSQEDNSDTRKHTGSGLGLTIARELTRTLGGELTLESEKEKGTRCRVHIPCEATDIEVSKNENESNQKINANATEGLRVLIVDDNKLNIKLLQQFLKPYKLEVDSCLNGQLALEKIRIIEYDAIFMDLQMPVLDGYETVKKIRAGDAGYNSMNVPIAVVSANVLQGEIDRVNALDVKHFIPKPVDPNIVQSFLAMAVQSKSTNSII
ncbi:MAG: ATP-binding protein, partial [Verrucomicrobiota bacterium]